MNLPAAASEEHYRLLFENNPNPMWVYDTETLRFLAVNDAAIAVYGWSRDDFLTMSIEDIRPAEQVASLHSEIAPLDRGLNNSGVWRHCRNDGSEFDAEITSNDHVFDGRPARVVTAVDVTERVRAEEALRQSEARYRDLFENASDLIATVDLRGRITAVNEAFVRAIGYSREELIGSRLEDLVPAESHRILLEARERKLAGSEATTYEHELVAKDGDRIQIEVSSRLIEEGGVVVGTEAICRDITERRLLEEQLREGQRLESIGRLAGGVAHDFNNLLTVISGYTELLLNGDPESKAELTQIAAAAGRATVLTRQLLAFSRRQVLQPRIVVVNDVVLGLTPMLERLIGDDVELVTDLAPSLHPVLADPSQLEQILLNLTVNAGHAMPSGGRLTIRTANVELDDEYADRYGDGEAGPHVLLSVSDTGTGMDAETLSHIFEPFFTTKPAGTGTGLGLSTVYGIVKQSDGSIWAYSEPNEGSMFKVFLPRTDEHLEEVPKPVSPRAESGSETILVAEDEPSLRRLVTRILERHGYTVIAASSSPEALRIAEAREGPIDLLLTDLVMPDLSGGDLAKAIGAILPDMPVVFMSGYADDVVTRERTLDPDSPFLEKPFSADDLARKIR
ncbi:MAG: PAS domain S-box protein, partial [Actinobacteria bacterium]|nr:PAS domain S-box protein [Actinomycetota bacterium]